MKGSLAAGDSRPLLCSLLEGRRPCAPARAGGACTLALAPACFRPSAAYGPSDVVRILDDEQIGRGRFGAQCTRSQFFSEAEHWEVLYRRYFKTGLCLPSSSAWAHKTKTASSTPSGALCELGRAGRRSRSGPNQGGPLAWPGRGVGLASFGCGASGAIALMDALRYTAATRSDHPDQSLCADALESARARQSR